MKGRMYSAKSLILVLSASCRARTVHPDQAPAGECARDAKDDIGKPCITERNSGRAFQKLQELESCRRRGPGEQSKFQVRHPLYAAFIEADREWYEDQEPREFYHEL